MCSADHHTGIVIPFGKKHVGKLAESVVLCDPEYTLWFISVASQRYGYLREHLRQCIVTFDARPLVIPCFDCSRRAARFSIAGGLPDPWWWCERCNPFGGCDGSLGIGRTYRDALSIVRGRTARKSMIASLAKAKGLQRRTRRQLLRFFACNPDAEIPEFSPVRK